MGLKSATKQEQLQNNIDALLRELVTLTEIANSLLQTGNTTESSSDSTLTAIEADTTAIDNKLTTTNTELSTTNTNLSGIDTKLNIVNSNLDNVELYTLRDIDAWDKIVGNSIETVYTVAGVTARNPSGTAGNIDTKTYKTGAGVTTVVTIEYTYDASDRLIKTEAV